jgi:hypothetical protein
MKKSKIIIALGLFALLTAYLGMSGEKMYQKQKHFQTTDEIIQQISDKPLKMVDDRGILVDTNEFKECFSERKRLTDIQFYYGEIDIEKVNTLNENQKKVILDEYDGLRSNFSKSHEITKEEPIRLTVTAYYDMYSGQGTIKYDRPQKLIFDMVAIDEGEGLVIDYIKYYKSQEEGNVDA